LLKKWQLSDIEMARVRMVADGGLP